MSPAILQEVIDIPSSPEPVNISRNPRSKKSSPRPKSKSKQRSRALKAVPPATAISIIDLSKDDDSLDSVGAAKFLASAGSAARPSGVPSTPFTFVASANAIKNPFSEGSPAQPSTPKCAGASKSVQDGPADLEPAPEKPPVPTDDMLAFVVEVMPDILPAHANMLLNQLFPTFGANTAHAVVQQLFDHPEYPKVDRSGKGKRKRDGDDDGRDSGISKKERLDYASITRPYPESLMYSLLVENQLFEDFPLVPRPYIRKVLADCNRFYAPTHFRLLEDAKLSPLPYHVKRNAHNAKGKGKGKAAFDADFEAEREWLVTKLIEQNIKEDEALAERIDEEEYEDTGDGLECGCCFGDFAFARMVQCAEGHLFCRECARRNAEEQIGSRKTDLCCMDQSDCSAGFPESEIERFLPPKTLALYYRIKQGKEIENAGLEGLESCPYCDYCCVIENAEEKLFRCENEDCMVVSCRKCKKQDHLPRSCKEVEEDSKLNARHAVEEAMTNALMRKCPKCQYSFVKEQGCNKMTCPQCRTLSCYVCRQIIIGYDHFNQAPPYNTAKDPTKCPLWDTDLERTHADEVAAAARKAQAELLAKPDNGVKLDAKDLEVELPVAPPRPPGPGPGQPGYNGGAIPREYLVDAPFAAGFGAPYERHLPDALHALQAHRHHAHLPDAAARLMHPALYRANPPPLPHVRPPPRALPEGIANALRQAREARIVQQAEEERHGAARVNAQRMANEALVRERARAARVEDLARMEARIQLQAAQVQARVQERRAAGRRR